MIKNMGTDVSQLKIDSTHEVPVQFSTNFYCPANTQQKRFREAFWSYSISWNATNRRWQGYRVLGYAFLWKAPWNNNGTLPIIGLGPDGLQLTHLKNGLAERICPKHQRQNS